MSASNIRALTGLRGFAAWWVVLYHFQEPLAMLFGPKVLLLVKQGYLAVDLFFILSGFVIFINYGDQFRSLSRKTIAEFYVKRIARIYPLYLTVLLLFVVNPLAIYFYSRAASYQDRYDLYYFILSIFMVQNWGFTDSIRWNIPAWSISTEFAAYLLFPLFAYIFNNARAFGKYFLQSLFCLSIFGIGVIFYSLGYQSLGDGIPVVGVYRCMLEFLLGMIAGHLYGSNKLANFHKKYLLSFILLLYMIGYFLELPNYFYMPAVFFLAVLYFSNPSGLHATFFGSRPFYYLGEISYSTYLIHFFIKDWVKFLSPVVGVESLLYYLIAIFFSSVLLHRYVEVLGQRSTYGLMVRFVK